MKANDVIITGLNRSLAPSVAASCTGIKVGDDIIGGVGLSGSPGVDEPCVQAGIDLVKDQLK